jgi:hypothetical protein
MRIVTIAVIVLKSVFSLLNTMKIHKTKGCDNAALYLCHFIKCDNNLEQVAVYE